MADYEEMNLFPTERPEQASEPHAGPIYEAAPAAQESAPVAQERSSLGCVSLAVRA